MNQTIEAKPEAPAFTKMLNMAAERFGAKALSCSDDFFAGMDNLCKPGRGIFITDKYTERGKWMDGWESRRKRTSGHDWCIVELGAPGVIHGLDIDTNHFLGNHPPHASVEACHGDPRTAAWVDILPKSALDPGSQHFFAIESREIWTHVKLHIYPDGGVARLKVYGEVYKDWDVVEETDELDLLAAVNGGRAVCCNDMFFSAMDNLLMPGRGVNMGDGWETKRNRTPNNRDWVILKLGHKGTINTVCVDTHHFKGNYPDTCSIEGAVLASAESPEAADASWEELLPKSKLEAHKEHYFHDEISNHGPYTHIRLNIYPDGGVSRLRLFGKIVKE